ncbi:Hypothetical_protein [Hexamita inflata]|uniref:Hypothetical_protein n=1 Tax=Hexamita inflata TaxID=28002 RepID=A0AA86NYZ1_9EUKA|nr:Hypothetical protein HINF_LOCUS15247 [Hexamita inflata]
MQAEESQVATKMGRPKIELQKKRIQDRWVQQFYKTKSSRIRVQMQQWCVKSLRSNQKDSKMIKYNKYIFITILKNQKLGLGWNNLKINVMEWCYCSLLYDYAQRIQNQFHFKMRFNHPAFAAWGPFKLELFGL